MPEKPDPNETNDHAALGKMSVDSLCEQFIEAKKFEDRSKSYRLRVEIEILKREKCNIKDEGTGYIGPLKIVTGYSEKWNSEKLSELFKQNPMFPHPFKPIPAFELIKDRVAWMEEHAKEYWTRLQVQALTRKKKKPAFSIFLNQYKKEEK